MGVEIDGFDEDELMGAIADEVLEASREYLETEANKDHFECPECGSTEFDIKAYTDGDDIKGAGICLDCNTRTELDVDTSEIADLK